MKPIRNLTILMFAVLMSMHLAAFAARSVELEEPGPISVPAGHSYTLEEVRAAIVAGAKRHHWQVESQAPGVVRLILDQHRGRVVLVMDAVYDEKNYSLKYVRSEGMYYMKGIPTTTVSNPNSNTISTNTSDHLKTTIHSSYLRWTRGLTSAINTELYAAQMK